MTSESHIPLLSTVSLGSNHPDLPSVLQVGQASFHPLGLCTCCSLCLDQTSPSRSPSHAELLILQTSAQISPLQRCLPWRSHAKGRSLCYSLSKPPISFFDSIYHNLQLSVFTYLSHPWEPCLSWSYSRHLVQCLALSICQINICWVNLHPHQVIFFFLNQNAFPSLYALSLYSLRKSPAQIPPPHWVLPTVSLLPSPCTKQQPISSLESREPYCLSFSKHLPHSTTVVWLLIYLFYHSGGSWRSGKRLFASLYPTQTQCLVLN